MKKVKPEFYALVYDFNRKQLTRTDIMDYLLSNPIKYVIDYEDDNDTFKKIKVKDCSYNQIKSTIRQMLFSQYAYRYEYELDVAEHFCFSSELSKLKKDLENGKSIEDAFDAINYTEQRIDVYSQIEPNLDIITRLYLDYKGLTQIIKK